MSSQPLHKLRPNIRLPDHRHNLTVRDARELRCSDNVRVAVYGMNASRQMAGLVQLSSSLAERN